jgi:AraC family transcriptional regulator
MPSKIDIRPLRSGPEIVVSDISWRTDRHGYESYPEEQAPAHTVIFMRTGICALRIGHRELIADANHVLFLNCGQSYRVAHPVAGAEDCTAYEFQSDLVQEVVTSLRPRAEERSAQPFEFTHVASDSLLFLLHERLRQCMLAATDDKLKVDELALELLGTSLHLGYLAFDFPVALRRSGTAEARRAAAEATQMLLAGSLSENLKLSDIAKCVHCSPFHLARLFRAETGMPIHQYRHRLRLRAALVRVAAGETDFARMALELGFSSHSHLTDTFKRCFGLPPSECRRRANSEYLHELSTNLEVRRRARAYSHDMTAEKTGHADLCALQI